MVNYLPALQLQEQLELRISHKNAWSTSNLGTRETAARLVCVRSRGRCSAPHACMHTCTCIFPNTYTCMYTPLMKRKEIDWQLLQGFTMDSSLEVEEKKT